MTVERFRGRGHLAEGDRRTSEGDSSYQEYRIVTLLTKRESAEVRRNENQTADNDYV